MSLRQVSLRHFIRFENEIEKYVFAKISKIEHLKAK
jgi:hypothetical protein